MTLADFLNRPLLTLPLYVWIVLIIAAMLGVSVLIWFLRNFTFEGITLLGAFRFNRKAKQITQQITNTNLPSGNSAVFGEAFRKYFATILSRPFYPIPTQLDYLEKTKAALEKVPIVCLVGFGGVGKTTLAGELIRQSPNLGFHKPIGDSAKQSVFEDTAIQKISEPLKLEWEELVNTIVRQLGHKSLTSQKLAKRENFIKKKIKLNKYIILVDNLESSPNADDIINHLKVLLKDTNSKALVTYRYYDVSHITSVYTVNVGGLTETDSYQYIECELKARGIENIDAWLKLKDDNHDVLREIIKYIRGLPLALQLVIGLRTTLPLASVLDLLREITADTRVEQIYQFLFESELKLLTADSFHVLTTVFGKEIGFFRSDIERLLQKPPQDFLRSLAELGRLSLVYSVRRERDEKEAEDYFFVHPMLHELLKNSAFMEKISHNT